MAGAAGPARPPRGERRRALIRSPTSCAMGCEAAERGQRRTPTLHHEEHPCTSLTASCPPRWRPAPPSSRPAPSPSACGAPRRRLDDRLVPLLGVTGAFVFAAQMLNFPVAGGTSGHFLGAALATVLLGPWLACLVLAVVLTTQSFVFADGGVSALGANIVNMGVLGALAAGGLMLAARRVLPRRRGVLLGVAGAGAWLAVMAGAAGTVGLPRALGHGAARHRAAGDARRPPRDRRRRGAHHGRRAERADGDAARPDRRLGARRGRRAPRPSRRRSEPEPCAASPSSRSPSPSLLGVAFSPFASSSPDGLEKVAADRGFLDQGRLARRAGGRARARLRVPRRRGRRASRPRSPGSPARSACSRSAAGWCSSSGAGRGGAGVMSGVHALESAGLAGDPASPVHRLDARAKLLGLAGLTLVAATSPRRGVAAAGRLRGAARRGRARRPRAGARRRGGARASCSRSSLLAAASVPFLRQGGDVHRRRAAVGPRRRPDRVRRRRREGGRRHAERGPARRHDDASPPRWRGCAGCARPPCSWRSPASRGATCSCSAGELDPHAHGARRPRAPAAPPAADRGDRAARHRAVPARARPRRARPRRDGRARLDRRAARARRRARCAAPTSLFVAALAGLPLALRARAGAGRMTCAVHARGLTLRLRRRPRGARRPRPDRRRTASASPCSARTAPARRR